MSLFYRCACFVWVACSLMGCSTAKKTQTISPAITGIVRNMDGTPIEDATVIVYRNEYAKCARTDANGRYVLAPIRVADPMKLFDFKYRQWPSLLVIASAPLRFPKMNGEIIGKQMAADPDNDPQAGGTKVRVFDFKLKHLPLDGD